MKFRIEAGREVPGGWTFPVKDGPLIKADSDIPGDAVEELVDKLTAYRVQNGLPVGQPHQDILDYYIKTYPFTVENGEEGETVGPDVLAADVAHWVNSQWKSPPKALVELDVAQARGRQCGSCPFRDDISVQAGHLASETKRRLYLLSRALQLPNEVGLCSVHRWDNRLACLLPKPKDTSCPHQCWLDKEDIT